MMKKVLLWGANKEYINRRQYLKYEELKGNIKPVAICSADRYANVIDGLKVIEKVELKEYDFDYIIVFNDVKFDIIKNDICNLGYDAKTIITSKVLTLPNFDFLLYVQLIENPITIICEDCWGAMLYSYLYLPFTSPFILFAIDDVDQYFDLVENLQYYLKQPFVMEQESDIKRGIWPIASLGEKVYIQCYHYDTFQSAKNAWEKRI